MSEHCGCRRIHRGGNIQSGGVLITVNDEACRYPAALEVIRRLREALDWHDTATEGKMACYCKVPPEGEDGIEAHDEACTITRAAVILTQGY